MRALLALAVLVALGATAQTVILYDDGTQYTVSDSEHVYVSYYSKLYQRNTYSKGDVFFKNSAKPKAGLCAGCGA